MNLFKTLLITILQFQVTLLAEVFYETITKEIIRDIAHLHPIVLSITAAIEITIILDIVLQIKQQLIVTMTIDKLVILITQTVTIVIVHHSIHIKDKLISNFTLKLSLTLSATHLFTKLEKEFFKLVSSIITVYL